ncbi:DUF448 domain-containing protein [Arcobacter sp. FWKO B]|uniref:DUF448 domain-containing protein n=1 Tax=Arcobacter sp. FWKO B TaxID=2593672 RepID=UPI0018A56030|nr:DUF448 domain-containing protein [Arcobacter sp. FWKO B]QOG13290.1 DUF448 domain-containing protein [Arcobacter sp. FWKO B]
MCIVCRNRFQQKELLRLQCIEQSLVLFTGTKRSFYICKECLSGDFKKLEKQFARVCRGKPNNLQEFISRSNSVC